MLVATLGESLVRFSVAPGVALEAATSLEVRAAGAESNVAIGLARLGVPARWISCLADDPLGRLVAGSVRRHGVDAAVTWWPEGKGRTGLYFVELGSPPRATRLLYDRQGTAFALARVEDLDAHALADAVWLHTTGIAAAVNGELVTAFLGEARRQGISTSFDVNYRHKLWPPEAARATALRLAGQLDLVFATSEDAALLFGLDAPPEEQAKALAQELGSRWTVVTTGARGAVCAVQGEIVSAGGHDLVAIDRIGAGDAFVAGFLSQLLEPMADSVGARTLRALKVGSAFAALAHSYYGDIVWTTRDEVLALAMDASRAAPWR